MPGSGGRDLAAYVDRLLALAAIGSPDECCERLAEIAAGTGLHHLLLFPEGAGSRPRTLDNLAHLAPVVPLWHDPVGTMETVTDAIHSIAVGESRES